MKLRYNVLIILLLLLAGSVTAETFWNNPLNLFADWNGNGQGGLSITSVTNGAINGTSLQVTAEGATGDGIMLSQNFSNNLTGNKYVNISFWLNISLQGGANRDDWHIGIYPWSNSSASCSINDGAYLYYTDNGGNTVVYARQNAGNKALFDVALIDKKTPTKITYEFNNTGVTGDVEYNIYVNDVRNATAMIPYVQACTIDTISQLGYVIVYAYSEGAPQNTKFYIDDLNIWNSTVTSVADTIVANVNSSTYELVSAFYNGTAWRTAGSGLAFTIDDTPTIQFNTSEIINASIGMQNVNYTNMIVNDSNLRCSTTDTTQHTCTLPVKYSLNVSHINTIYISLRDSAGNENASSTSGPLKVFFDTIPTQTTPVLNSTNIALNDTSVNLTLYSNSTDRDGDNLKNIITWRLGAGSVNILNLPFEGVNGSFQNNTHDYSNNGHNITEMGHPTWNRTGGVDGRGMYMFDGIDDHIHLNNTLGLLNFSAKNFTINLWAYATFNDTDTGTIFTNGFSAVADTGLSIRYLPNKLVEFSYGTSAVNSQALVNRKRWIMYSITNNLTDIDFWIDGKKNATINRQYVNSSNVDTFLGSRTHAAGLFNGSIDEVSFWNRSLSKEQIWNLYTLNYSSMASQELNAGDIWSAMATPNDGYFDDGHQFSNSVTITAPFVNSSPSLIIYSPSAAFQSSGSSVIYDLYFNDSDSAFMNFTIIENGTNTTGPQIVSTNSREAGLTSRSYPNGSVVTYYVQYYDGNLGFNSSIRNFSINTVSSHEALSLHQNSGRINITGNGTYAISMSWLMGWNMSGKANDTNFTYSTSLSPRFNLSNIWNLSIRQNGTGNTPNFTSNISSNITFTSFALNSNSCDSNIYSMTFMVDAINATNFENSCQDTGFDGNCSVSMNLVNLVSYRLSNLDMLIDHTIISHWEERRSIDIDYLNLSNENKTQASGSVNCGEASGLGVSSFGNSTEFEDDSFGGPINNSAPSSTFSGSISDEQTTLNPSITADSAGITLRGFSIGGSYEMSISYSWNYAEQGGVGIPAGSAASGGGRAAQINVFEIIGNISVNPKNVDVQFFKIPFLSKKEAQVSIQVSVVPELCVFERPSPRLRCYIDSETKIVQVVYEPAINNTKFSEIEQNRLIIRAKGGQAFVPVQFRLIDFTNLSALIMANLGLIIIITLVYLYLRDKKK